MGPQRLSIDTRRRPRRLLAVAAAVGAILGGAGCIGTEPDGAPESPADCFPDADGDGLGDSTAARIDCATVGSANNADDCDDGEPAVPGTEALCDGVDQDCDGVDSCPLTGCDRTGLDAAIAAVAGWGTPEAVGDYAEALDALLEPIVGPCPSRVEDPAAAAALLAADPCLPPLHLGGCSENSAVTTWTGGCEDTTGTLSRARWSWTSGSDYGGGRTIVGDDFSSPPDGGLSWSGSLEYRASGMFEADEPASGAFGIVNLADDPGRSPPLPLGLLALSSEAHHRERIINYDTWHYERTLSLQANGILSNCGFEIAADFVWNRSKGDFKVNGCPIEPSAGSLLTVTVDSGSVAEIVWDGDLSACDGCGALWVDGVVAGSTCVSLPM